MSYANYRSCPQMILVLMRIGKRDKDYFSFLMCFDFPNFKVCRTDFTSAGVIDILFKKHYLR